PDNRGNLIIIEDVGGTRVSIDPNNPNGATKTAANPNSFVYRFVPNNIADLSAGGKLQALQVSIDGQAVKFVAVDATQPFGDVFFELISMTIWHPARFQLLLSVISFMPLSIISLLQITTYC